MNPDDLAYFDRRARQERRHASEATHPETRMIPAELADRYEALLAPAPKTVVALTQR